MCLVCVGPIVRINPEEIHLSDSNWLDTLYPGPSRYVELIVRLVVAGIDF